MLLTKYCKNHPEDIFFDENQDFFFTIHKSFFEINDELKIYNNEAYYKDKKPFFIHGPSCTYLNLLIKNLNYNISESDIDKIKTKMKKNYINKGYYYFNIILNKYSNILSLILIILFIYIVKIKSKV